jgi:hypothetical protein
MGGIIDETTGQFPAGGQLVYTVTATLVSSDTIVTNTATVTSLTALGDTSPNNNHVTHVSAPVRDIYLPIIVKNFVQLPDLIIVPGSLVATTNGVTLTIRNDGNNSVTDAFWVDVYYGLTSPPGLNQAGNIYWGLSGANGGIPIGPGDVVTLTLSSPYYAGGSPPTTAGTTIYGQVDSFGSPGFGAVRESNEANNVSGPATSTTAVSGASNSSITNFNPDGLPSRE